MTRNTYPIEPAKAFPGAVADGDTDMQQDKLLRYESTYSNMLKTWARYIPTGALNRSAGGMAAIARDQRGGGGEPVRPPVPKGRPSSFEFDPGWVHLQLLARDICSGCENSARKCAE